MCDLLVLLISFDIVWHISSVPDVFLNGINYIWCFLTLFLNYPPKNKNVNHSQISKTRIAVYFLHLNINTTVTLHFIMLWYGTTNCFIIRKYTYMLTLYLHLSFLLWTSYGNAYIYYYYALLSFPCYFCCY